MLLDFVVWINFQIFLHILQYRLSQKMRSLLTRKHFSTFVYIMHHVIPLLRKWKSKRQKIVSQPENLLLRLFSPLKNRNALSQNGLLLWDKYSRMNTKSCWKSVLYSIVGHNRGTLCFWQPVAFTNAPIKLFHTPKEYLQIHVYFESLCLFWQIDNLWVYESDKINKGKPFNKPSIL